ncbi:hypothetical protein [Collimonas pratensis]|nr:hypothetical protein [Collimonas pratensis]
MNKGRMMEQPSTLEFYNHFLSTLLPQLHQAHLIGRYAGGAALQNHLNPLTSCGCKVYSQNDEDGITFEILRRLGLQKGVFAEFGVGNGMENNTLALAALGWSGFWVGAEDLGFNPNPKAAKKLNFHYQKEWISQSNIVNLYQQGLAQIERARCDLISLDLDGNDFYFVEELLRSGILPEIFIVEYNAKFIPPIRFKIEYNDQHRWAGDDYFGASLCSFSDLFEAHGYFLACCNVTGSNAFFVKNQYKKFFNDIPEEVGKLYASPKYFLTGLDVAGHPTSVKAIETIFSALNSGIETALE